MNKGELVGAVAQRSGLSREEANRAIDSTFAAIADSLRRGDGVKIVGFGSFTVIERAAAAARNPRTGTAVMVPALKAPRFRPGLPLKEAVRDS